jgi:hypothetical protein
MPAHNNADLDAAAEHAVVVRLLEDHELAVTRDELYAAQPDLGVERLDAAVLSLAEVKVVLVTVGSVRSTPALQRLDELRLLAI